MQRHAFLIVAHSCEKDLINLIKSIDYEYNDIFIHLDKKWRDCDIDLIKKAAHFSKVIFTERRVSVVWGHLTQIKAEMLLIRRAVEEGEYSYFHVLSGQDICIKKQAELHAFFDACEGKEFLCYCGKDWQDDAQKRIKYYHIKCGRDRIKLFIDKFFVKIQKILGIDRTKRTGMTFLGGSNWASITYAFAKYLLENEKFIFKTFSWTFCSDEIYKHTLAYNSRFKDKIYLLNLSEVNDNSDIKMNLANMRLIDWVRGAPYLFTEADYGQVLSSPCMFMRKVSSKNALPDMILEYLK